MFLYHGFHDLFNAAGFAECPLSRPPNIFNGGNTRSQALGCMSSGANGTTVSDDLEGLPLSDGKEEVDEGESDPSPPSAGSMSSGGVGGTCPSQRVTRSAPPSAGTNAGLWSSILLLTSSVAERLENACKYCDHGTSLTSVSRGGVMRLEYTR